MKTKLILFAAILAMVFTLNTYAQTKKNRGTTDKTYTVGEFSKIDSDIVGSIVFTQSPQTSVRAEGDAEIINILVVSVKDNTLKLSRKKDIKYKMRDRKGKNLIVYVSAPELSAIENEGVGNITINGKFSAPELFIKTEGVGNITANDLDCGFVKIDSEGVGNTKLGGTANTVEIKSEGVGNVYTEKLLSKQAKVRCEGVGNVRVYATESLDARTAGIGNITYYGNPAQKEIRKNGMGRIRAKE